MDCKIFIDVTRMNFILIDSHGPGYVVIKKAQLIVDLND